MMRRWKSGALFFHELQGMTGLLPSRLEDALSELAAMGLVTADGFAAIRGMAQHSRQRARSGRSYFAQSGRWTLFPGHMTPAKPEDRLVQWAGQLLRRYGIVCRDVLAREAMAPPWWELVRVFRRLEARGDVRGGRFVSQVAGEQYALPGAVEMLRRSREDEQHYLVISAVDPLNLTGILSPGARVPAIRGYRLLLHNGRLLAALEAGEVQFSVEPAHGIKDRIIRALRLQALPVREQILKELSERNVSAPLS